MHNCNSHRDNKGVGIPEAFAIATKSKGEDKKRQIRAQEVLFERAKRLYCGQGLSTVGDPGSKYS